MSSTLTANIFQNMNFSFLIFFALALLILDCFIGNFKLKYEDSENIKSRSCRYSHFQLTSNQTEELFGTPSRLVNE